MLKQMKLLKLLLSVLLFLCLLDMPHGYYQFVRFVSLILFSLFAYDYYERKNIPLTIVFTSLAILFQPLLKISLGRQIWNIIDVAVGIFLIVLLVSIYLKRKR